MEEWFASYWPVLLVGLGLFVLVSGILRKLAKLAFVGVALGVLGLMAWPMVSSSL